VLGRRGGLNDDGVDSQEWMGRIKELKNEMKKDFKAFKETISESMHRDLEHNTMALENHLKDNLKALEDSIRIRHNHGIISISQKIDRLGRNISSSTGNTESQTRVRASSADNI
jgi:hypothetical protein